MNEADFAGVVEFLRLAERLKVDKLETILQHVQGANPPDVDYRFNLAYGRADTAAPPLVAELRRMLDDATEHRAREAGELRTE